MFGNNLKVLMILMGCILMLFTGCGTPSPEPTETAQAETKDGGSEYITAGQAKESALENAGIPKENAEFMHVHLDTKEGVSVYELRFVSGSQEYDYAVNALTGEIISMNCQNTAYDTTLMSTESSQIVDAQEAAAPQEAAAQKGGTQGTAEQYIGIEAAKQIALEYAGVAPADAQFLKAEFDYDDGRAEYEVEWKVGIIEYSCDVDACTGEVLAFEKDFD